ncbi:MAG: hypothetical protein MN733_00595 [Nitrososphaera sp.]|nr:hypothetical protein [Nitrososphaera sp.]
MLQLPDIQKLESDLEFKFVTFCPSDRRAIAEYIRQEMQWVYDGVSDGLETSWSEGREIGYTVGRNVGYKIGRADGYEKGYDDGYAAGLRTKR